MSHANLTLLTPEEAVAFSPAKDHLSGSALFPFIRSQEENLFNTRFGWDFYEKLKSDRYSYALRTSTLPADDGAGNRYYYYQDTTRTDIVAGDFVLFDDVVYKAKINVDLDGIGVENTDYYQRADRFQSACLQQLWSNYLRYILATASVSASVLSRTFQDTQRGALKQYEEGKSKSLSTGEIVALKKEHQTDIETMIANMERHINRSADGCFELYGQLESSDFGWDNTSDDGLITARSGTGRRIRNHGFSGI